MKRNLSLFKLFPLVFVILISRGILFGQQHNDDPNLDQIPQWYLNQIQKMPLMPSEVITIDGYDNYYLGVDFAEGHITVNPLNPVQFFTAYNIDDAHYTNDGHNWLDSNPVWGTSMRGDPVTAYDGVGNLYFENMYGSSSILGCKVVVSSDNGETWGPAVNAISGNDKNWMAADQTNGPFANYVYSTMTNNGSGNFVRSTDYGQTWQSTFSPPTQQLPGMMVCVGPNDTIPGGSVYVVTNSGNAFASVYTFYESNDGGLTFTNKSSQQFSGYVGTSVNGRHSVENMRTRPYPFITADNSNGPYRGRLHLVYASNYPAGNGNKPDIWARYSDDGGATWSDAKRVNSGLNAVTSHQWQPATWCDSETGRLYVQWMDSRDTPTNDSALIYATYSDTGGESFVVNKKISNEKMKINCNTCGGGGTPRYQGDYTGIVSNSDVSMSAWSDYRWGSFASFTAYFPDFAMQVNPTVKQVEYRDTIWVVIPSVKLYDNDAIFSANIENPPSGSFTIEYPEGNVINFNINADSIPIVITANQVPLGDYQITIKGEGPNGTPVHYRDATIQIIPLSPPTADFTASDTLVCAGYDVEFMDMSQNAMQWLWTFDGGTPSTSTEQFPTGIVYEESGSYGVTLEVTNTAGTDFINKPDYISVSLRPDSPVGENASTCFNSEVPSLIAQGEGILWYGDADLTQIVSTGNIFQPTDTLPGIYLYYATQTVAGCESEALELSLTIFNTPNVIFSPMDTVCKSVDPFEIENGSPFGGIYFGNGVEDGIFNPTIAGVGTHILGYAYADTNSCADTAYQNITVLDIDDVSLNPFASTCLNSIPFELSGGSPEGGTYSGEGVVENIFNPIDAGEGNHSIYYTIISSNGCPSSVSQTITVNGLPEVNIGNDTTICGDQTITLNATTSGAVSYLWTPGDFTTPSIIVDSTNIGYGTQDFNVFVVDDNTCSNTSEIAVTFINCTGISEIEGLKSVSLYPNPNDGSFNFNINSVGKIDIKVKIYDAVGNLHFDQKLVNISSDYKSKVELLNPKSGVYFLYLKNDSGLFIKKFVIK